MADSRNETILTAGVNGDNVANLEPQSRNEALLIELIKKIGAGGGSDNSIDIEKMNQFYSSVFPVGVQTEFTEESKDGIQNILDDNGSANILMALVIAVRTMWFDMYGQEPM